MSPRIGEAIGESSGENRTLRSAIDDLHGVRIPLSPLPGSRDMLPPSRRKLKSDTRLGFATNLFKGAGSRAPVQRHLCAGHARMIQRATGVTGRRKHSIRRHVIVSAEGHRVYACSAICEQSLRENRFNQRQVARELKNPTVLDRGKRGAESRQESPRNACIWNHTQPIASDRVPLEAWRRSRFAESDRLSLDPDTIRPSH